jgi:hypothetical protein
MSPLTIHSPTYREPALLGLRTTPPIGATYDIDGGQQFVAA